MSSTSPEAPNTSPTPSGSQPLASIQPVKQLRITPSQVRQSEGLQRVITIQIGGAILIGMLGIFAWPFGLRVVSFVFALGIVVMAIGLLTGRTTLLLRQALARNRAKKRGQLTFTNGVLIVPTENEPQQFELKDNHTLLRAWYMLGEGDDARSMVSMLIAQDGQRAIIYSDEPCTQREAELVGFAAQESLPFIQKPKEDYVGISLGAIFTLSRSMDAYLASLSPND